MLNSRNESIDDSQSNPNNKSGINTMMYNTPAQTNLQPNGNHEQLACFFLFTNPKIELILII
jgi:hypothetical protein